MPVIQQENGVRSIKGLPASWGRKAYRELHKAMQGWKIGTELPHAYTKLSALLDDVTASPIPLDATDAQLCIVALHRAQFCASMTAVIHDKAALRQRMQELCEQERIEPPRVEDDARFIARCIDPAWWRKRYRNTFGRIFEHAAIRLGKVSKFAGMYVSDETLKRYMDQQRENQKMLEATRLVNNLDQEHVLADIVAKTTAAKSIRAGEVMVRMRGMEAYAAKNGLVGVFITLTCPSKYHAVLSESGETNPNYNNANPRQANTYLCNVWKCQRAAYGRLGLRPLGMRIAEPHHDGCPHWHMMFFLPPEQVGAFCKVMREYALAEDGDEPGARRNRVKIVRIEAEQGTATGYILKYVLKNTGDKKLQHDGYTSQKNIFGDEEIHPGMRVQAWASKWHIRQFQGIGEPPVTVYREVRRVDGDKVKDAPEHIQALHAAVQKDVDAGKRVDYCAYLEIQGVGMGRDYRIGLAKELRVVQGRYGMDECEKPIGIYDRRAPEKVYASTRYEWRVAGRAAKTGFPWTRVNNCTEPTEPVWVKHAKDTISIEEVDFSDWFDSDEFRKIEISESRRLDMLDAAYQDAIETRKRTVWTLPNRKNLSAKHAH
jgi:hypothetical protein